MHLIVFIVVSLLGSGFGHMGHDHGHDDTNTTEENGDDQHDHHYHEDFDHDQPGGLKWEHNLKLGSSQRQMSIKWNSSDPEFLFMEMCGRVAGYVAVGFCAPWKGTMEGCDIVIGWVQQNKPNLIDSYATGNHHPINDNNQDYSLVSGSYENGMTRIIFKRKWNTQDKYDVNLKNNSVQVIWAWQTKSPKKENDNLVIEMHETDTRSHTHQMFKLDQTKVEHEKEHVDHAHAEHAYDEHIHDEHNGAMSYNSHGAFLIGIIYLIIYNFV